MYKCLIIDDESLARELIETHLSQLENFKIIASCSSALKAHKILQSQEVDLIFLDIEMPVLKGTDFFKNLRNKPKVIFTTAYREYALDGFELNAIDYLLKPITFERFFNSIEKFIESTQLKKATKNEGLNNDDSYIFVKIKKKNVKISFQEINYVESFKDYIKIHLENDSILIKHGLTSFQEKLDDRFIRVHRSYVVNSHKITAYTKHDIEIDRIEIPIGDYYKMEVLSKIK